MWKSHLDPYLTIHVTDSSAFLPVIIEIPNVTPSIHVALYLPTAGKEAEYLSELAKLNLLLMNFSVSTQATAFTSEAMLTNMGSGNN